MSLLEDFDDDVAPAQDGADLFRRPNAQQGQAGSSASSQSAAAAASAAAARAPSSAAMAAAKAAAAARMPAQMQAQRPKQAQQQQQKKQRPIFSIGRFPNPEQLPHSKRTDVAIGGRTIVVCTEGAIVRWSKTERGEDVYDTIELPSGRGGIHKVFIDHTGNHIVVSLVDGENYYVHQSSKKMHFLRNLNNEVVNVVLWDTIDGTPNFTKNILLGTASGRIFETALERSLKAFKFVKRTEVGAEIVDLHNELLSNVPGQPRKMCIIVTTVKGQTFQFLGGPDYATIFEKYAEKRVLDHRMEVRSKLPDCPIRFTGRKGAPATGFAVLTDQAVISGLVKFNVSEEQSVLVKSHNSMLDLTTVDAASNPSGLVVTDFHFIVLDDSGISIVNRVSKERAFFYPSKQFGGPIIKLLQHPGMDIILVCTQDRIFRIIKAPDEGRDMWTLYLKLALAGDEAKFELARKFCSSKQQADKVDLTEAEHYFDKKDFVTAARKYAHTNKSFEDIVLKFLDVEDNMPLTSYLLEKLDSLDKGMTSQKTILCTWIVEIFLNRINALEDVPEDGSSGRPNAAADLKRTRRQFKNFVKRNKEFLSRENRETIIKLLSSHGRDEELLFFAELVKDYERVLTHHIQQGNYDEALMILEDLDVDDDIDSIEELFYKFSPVLMQQLPERTVEMWKRNTPWLRQPCKLIPALVKHDQHRQRMKSQGKGSRGNDFAINYLKFAVKECNNEDLAIHNFLLALLARKESDKDLMAFLKDTLKSGKTHFDLQYALRLCSREKKHCACIMIYSELGLYEEAVNLALEWGAQNNNYDLAKQNAKLPQDDEKKKQLWLRIAEHIIVRQGQLGKNANIKDVMAILKECPLLSIEDILPFFPDEVQINEFRDEICKSLQEYNDKIHELKEDMKEYTDIAERIRDDINSLQTSYSYVGAKQVCALSGQPIFNDTEFFVFPCCHVYKTDMLIAEMLLHLDAEQREEVRAKQARIADIKDEIQRAKKEQLTSSKPSVEFDEASRNSSELVKLQRELDAIIASECPLCGDITINAITDSLVDLDDAESTLDWTIDEPTGGGSPAGAYSAESLNSL